MAVVDELRARIADAKRMVAFTPYAPGGRTWHRQNGQ